MAEIEILVFPGIGALAEEAARHFVALAEEAIAERGRFGVALAGGSTPVALYRLLAQPPRREQIDWSRTLVCFGDERCVPPNHPDSNFAMAQSALLAHVPVPAANVLRMAGEQPGPQAAAAYAAELSAALGGGAQPRLDLVLLGMGEDGHTASLFPGMPALTEPGPVLYTSVPEYVRPAVARLTLALPVLNAARHVIFLVAGSAKAGAAARALAPEVTPHPTLSRRAADPHANPFQDPDRPPAGLVHPADGSLTWLLDSAAAANLRPANPA